MYSSTHNSRRRRCSLKSCCTLLVPLHHCQDLFHLQQLQRTLCKSKFANTGCPPGSASDLSCLWSSSSKCSCQNLVTGRLGKMANLDIDKIINGVPHSFSKTKIICTLGPKSREVPMLEKLLQVSQPPSIECEIYTPYILLISKFYHWGRLS